MLGVLSGIVIASGGVQQHSLQDSINQYKERQVMIKGLDWMDVMEGGGNRLHRVPPVCTQVQTVGEHL